MNIKKSILSVLLMIVVVLSLTGCENNISESDKIIDNPSKPSVPSVVEEKIYTKSTQRMISSPE